MHAQQMPTGPIHGGNALDGQHRRTAEPHTVTPHPAQQTAQPLPDRHQLRVAHPGIADARRERLQQPPACLPHVRGAGHALRRTGPDAHIAERGHITIQHRPMVGMVICMHIQFQVPHGIVPAEGHTCRGLPQHVHESALHAVFQPVDRAIDRLEYGVEGGFVDMLRQASACVTFGWDDAVRYLELDMHAYDHADHRPVLNGDVAAFCDVCVGPGAAERVAGAADVRQARGRLLKAFAARVGDAGVRDAELMSVRERLGRLLGGMRGDRVRFGGSAMLAIEGVAAMNWAGWHLLRMHGIGCTEVRGVRVPSAEETACRLEEWAEAMADAWRESSRESELRRVTDVAWALADEVRRATKAI